MLLCFSACWAALWLGYDRLPQDIPPHAPPALNSRPKPHRWLEMAHLAAAITGIVLLWLLAEINGQFLKLEFLLHTSHNLQFAMLCAGIALFTWGMSGADPVHQLSPAERRIVYIERAALTALTIAALLMRLWQIGDAMRVFVDETHFIDPLRRFWHDSNVPLLQPFSSIAAFPYLFPYLQAAMVDQFGRDLTGLRIISAVFGALTVPAVYLLAKHLFDRKTAMIAAVLLMTFPPHLQFSRIGLNNIADPLFGVLAMGYLARGVRSGRKDDFVFGGAALGLTQYFYEGGRLLFPALIAIWLAFMLFTRWKRVARRTIALFLLCAVVVSAPVYYTLIGMGRPLAQRVATASLPTEFWEEGVYNPSEISERFTKRLTETSLLIMSRSEGAFYYNGDAPLVSVTLAPALILGIGIVLWRWQTSGGSLLILWMVFTITALALLMLNLATAARLVVIYPALILLAAVGIRHFSKLLLGEMDFVTAIVVIALSISQGMYYYNVHLDKFLIQHYEHQPGQEAVFQAAELPPNTHVHIIHTDPINQIGARSMIEFLVDGITIYTHKPEDVDRATLETFPRNVNQAFFIRWSDEKTKRLLARYYDINPDNPILGGNQWTLLDPFVLYFVPAEAAG